MGQRKEDGHQEAGAGRRHTVSSIGGMETQLDLMMGYYQIPVQEGDIHKWQWEFLWMPFGLRNAGQSLQRLMDQVLTEVDFTFCYLDDVLIGSTSTEEHHHLHLVLQQLRQYEPVLNIRVQ